MKLRVIIGFVAVLANANPAFAQQQQSSAGAMFETRLSTMEDELRALNGQVEQLAFSIRRLDQNVQRMQGDYDQRLAKLETNVNTLNTEAAQRAAAPPLAPTASPVAPPMVDGTLGALRTQKDGRVTGAVNNPQAPPLPEVKDTDILSPQEQYDDAFALLRQANYEEAEKSFKEFIDKNPKDKMIDNAKYWHAETLYVRGKFPDAASGFADAYQQNPQGNKAPDSLLKLSMSLSAMNKTPEACVALAQLKAKYPTASATVKTRAAEQRTKLKCS